MVIEVPVDADADYILHLIRQSNESSIVLILGPYGSPMTSWIDLNRLRWEINERPRVITVYSSDSNVVAMAQTCGFDVVGTGSRLGKLLDYLAIPFLQTYKLMAPQIRRKLIRGELLHSVITGPLVLGVAIAIIIGLYGFMLYPSADISIRTNGQEEISGFRVIADPATKVIGTQKGVIPARVIEVAQRGSRTSAATGERIEPLTRATGRVLLINPTAAQVFVPRGTVLSSRSGVQFETSSDVLVPESKPGKSNPAVDGEVVVAIAAQAKGEVGNVSAGEIDKVLGPLRFTLSVKQEQPLRGGSESTLRYVSNQDKKSLSTTLMNELLVLARDDLESKISDTEMVQYWPDRIQAPILIDEEFFEIGTGSVSEVSVTQEIVLRATVISRDDILEAAMINLTDAGRRSLLSNEIRLTNIGLGSVIGGRVAVRFQASGMLGPAINEAGIADSLRGLSVDEAIAVLGQVDGVEIVDFKYWPRFSDSLPRLASRITVTVNNNVAR